MDRIEAIDILRRSEATLRARGVVHAALFGSVARATNGPDSDVDILVDVDPDTRMTVFDYVELKDFISSLFATRVDVVNRAALKPDIRPLAVADAIYAF